MKYAIISIDINSCNLGNRLIEYCVKKFCNLPAPTYAVSMFRVPTASQIAEINKCDFLLLPGSTILSRGSGESAALVALEQVKVPVYCTAASSWLPKRPTYVDIFPRISSPIGCRDPQILGECVKYGAPGLFVGCPTAYVVEKAKPEDNLCVFGFSRTNIPWQAQLVNMLKKKFRVVAAMQENVERKYVRSLGVSSFSYEDPIATLRIYNAASCVVTGRLHGILPAIGSQKQIMFFGDAVDSRFTLLQHLGVNILPMSGTPTLSFQESSGMQGKVQQLKATMQDWYTQTIGRHANG